MATYPDIHRLMRPELAYAGEVAVGATRHVGAGTLTQINGLPVLIPSAPARAVSTLRRP